MFQKLERMREKGKVLRDTAVAEEAQAKIDTLEKRIKTLEDARVRGAQQESDGGR